MDILRGQSPQHDIQFNLTTNENNHDNKKEKNHLQPGKWPDPKSRQSEEDLDWMATGSKLGTSQDFLLWNLR